MQARTDSLRAILNYEPQELQFGTSGRRGKVVDLTQLEIYINVLAELEYLQSLAPRQGGIVRGEEFFLAYDLRPSSISFVAEQRGCGEIVQGVVTAVRDAGMLPVNLGPIPTPALTIYAISRNKGSIMVTGSHIPFDRNGYKLNTSVGELRKDQEAPIDAQVRRVRERIYSKSWEGSQFNERGLFKVGHQALPPESGAAQTAWIERYTKFFAGKSLRRQRLLVYEHSAVGRDLLAEILKRLGADVIVAGRSDTFVPIDTENVGAGQLATIQGLSDATMAKHGSLFAVLSTDGDSDRPLILAVDPSTAKLRFFGGDLVGMVAAEYLHADSVSVPISCNDAIDRGNLMHIVEPKTRIGSPFVIAAMEAALRKGKKRVCGFESNGGFLTGSDFERNGAILKALPTRDAALPILSVLFASSDGGLPLIDLFDRLPKRFSRAALLKDCPRSVGLKVLAYFSPGTAFPQKQELDEIRKRLKEFFKSESGFGMITALDYTDGLRVTFDNGDIAHVRPSGNADELRIYAVADTQERADAIALMGVAEPNGILRRMERAVAH